MATSVNQTINNTMGVLGDGMNSPAFRQFLDKTTEIALNTGQDPVALRNQLFTEQIKGVASGRFKTEQELAQHMNAQYPGYGLGDSMLAVLGEMQQSAKERGTSLNELVDQMPVDQMRGLAAPSGPSRPHTGFGGPIPSPQDYPAGTPPTNTQQQDQQAQRAKEQEDAQRATGGMSQELQQLMQLVTALFSLFAAGDAQKRFPSAQSPDATTQQPQPSTQSQTFANLIAANGGVAFHPDVRLTGNAPVNTGEPLPDNAAFSLPVTQDPSKVAQR